jgi:hypothetical protein
VGHRSLTPLCADRLIVNKNSGLSHAFVNHLNVIAAPIEAMAGERQGASPAALGLELSAHLHPHRVMMVVVMMAAGRNDDPSLPAITVVVVMMMTIVLGYLEARPGLVIGFVNGVESGFGVRYRI